MIIDSKQAALDLLEQYRAAYIRVARDVARKLGADGRSLTIDDVRTACPPPPGIDPRVMGCVLREPEWRSVGFVNSRRKTCHGRPVRLFTLSAAEATVTDDRAAA